MIQKIINTKIKTSLKFSIMVEDTDSYCLKNHYFSYITVSKVQIQGFTAKKSCFKEFKTKKSKLALYTKVAKPLEQDKKNKKRKIRKYRQKNIKE